MLYIVTLNHMLYIVTIKIVAGDWPQANILLNIEYEYYHKANINFWLFWNPVFCKYGLFEHVQHLKCAHVFLVCFML